MGKVLKDSVTARPFEDPSEEERDALRDSITKYLLGGLSKKEREALEDHYFSDGSTFEEMTIVEEELIDGYLRDEFPKPMRQEFEKSYFSSPERRKRVMEAAGFRNALFAVKDRETHGLNLSRLRYWLRGLLSFFASSNRILVVASLAFVLILLSLGCVLIVIKNTQLQSQISQTQAEKKALEERERQILDEISEQKAANDKLRDENQRARNQSEQLKEELESLKLSQLRSPAQIPDVSFELASNLVRGSSNPAQLEIPRNARLVELQLNLEANDYERFRVELQAEGAKTWIKTFNRREVASSNRQIIIRLPASLLSIGDHTITLSGASRDSNFEPIARYPFHVLRK